MNLTHDGITQPITEWALDYGILPDLITERLGRGWTIKDAIERPMHAPKGYRLPKPKRRKERSTTLLVEFNGVSRSVKEWADLLGLHPETIHGRLAKGLPVAAVLSANDGRSKREDRGVGRASSRDAGTGALPVAKNSAELEISA